MLTSLSVVTACAALAVVAIFDEAGGIDGAQSTAHILLLGWVSLALAGVIYHLYPAASDTRLAKAHFWIHNLVLPPFMVVLALFLTGTKAAGPVLGVASVVMIVGLACFMVNVLTNAKPAG